MTRTLLTLTLTLAIVPPSCVAPAPTVWQADERTYEPAVAAAEDWCRASDGAYCPAIAPSGEGRPIREAPYRASHPRRCGWITCDGAIEYAPEAGTCRRMGVVLERVDAGGCSRRTDDGVRATRDQILQGIIAHELGHDAGLADTDDPESIMATGIPHQPVYVSLADGEAVR